MCIRDSLMPDRKVNSCGPASDTVLCATSDSRLKFLKEGYNTCVLNLSTSDFRVDSSDSSCVNTDTSPLCNVFPNSHIRAKDTIEGVVNINQNTRCKLTYGCSDTCHNGRWDVESVLADCVVVLSDLIKPLFFRVFCEDSQCYHNIHELWCFVNPTTASVLYQVFIYNLA